LSLNSAGKKRECNKQDADKRWKLHFYSLELKSNIFQLPKILTDITGFWLNLLNGQNKKLIKIYTFHQINVNDFSLLWAIVKK